MKKINKYQSRFVSYLVTITGEATALHCARVVVASMVEIADSPSRVDVVEDGRETTTQTDHTSSVATYLNTHALLLRLASAVLNQTVLNQCPKKTKIIQHATKINKRRNNMRLDSEI